MPKIPVGDQMLDAVEVEVVSEGERWNEYQLADGTSMRLKVVVSTVYRVADSYDAEGNPLYVVRSSNVLAVRAPDNLKRTP